MMHRDNAVHHVLHVQTDMEIGARVLGESEAQRMMLNIDRAHHVV